jgi:hypothetical protein
MQLLVIVLRFCHVVAGGLWVGMAVFSAFLLGPAIDEAGPAASAIMPALQRRGVSTILPLLALVTVLSGFWLYWRIAGGDVFSYVQSGPGITFAISAVAAVLGYLVGVLVTRPSMMRAAMLYQAAAAGPPEDRPAQLAEAARWKTRGSKGGQLGGALLLVALAGMAIARYL